MIKFWNNLGFFWKVYLAAVVLIVGIVVFADFAEDFIPQLVIDRRSNAAQLTTRLDEYVAAANVERPALRVRMEAEGIWVMDIPLSALEAFPPKDGRNRSILDILPENDDWTTEWVLVDKILPDGRLVALGVPEPWFYDLLEWIMWLLVIAAFAGVSCYCLSAFLTSRLQRIALAAKQLASGHLSERLAVEKEGGDELSSLARSFNNMAQSIEEVLENERRLLYDISHELRSPLTRMHLALSLARQSPPEKTADYIKLLENDTERMSEMVEQIMEQGKAFSVMNELLLEPLDIYELLSETVALANFEFQRCGRSDLCRLGKLVVSELSSNGSFPLGVPPLVGETSTTVKANGKRLFLRGNRGQLEQAFYNVLSNAARYAPENTHIEISAKTVTRETDHEQVRIEIRDFGPGVPEDCLEKLFKPFFRVESARDRASGGVGLGLALATGYIRRHKGSISACNVQPGLMVCITLPLCEAP